MNNELLTNPRRILITAGAAGIGLAMAKKFASLNDRVAVVDIDATAIAAVPSNITAFHADCADEKAMDAVFTNIAKTWGGLDILLANAGVAGPTAVIEDVSLQEWKTCLAVNLDGAFIACRRAAAWMKKQGSGVIILTSSTAGLFGYPYRAPYATAKWGVIGLTKTLAMELGPYGIRVNAICPGAVAGERMDGVIQREAAARGVAEQTLRENYESCASMRRFVTADDIAETAVFLSSAAARNISGMAMSVDGHTEKLTV